MRTLLSLLVLVVLSCGYREKREKVARKAVANLYPNLVVVSVSVGGGCSERVLASVTARDSQTGATYQFELNWNERTLTVE